MKIELQFSIGQVHEDQLAQSSVVLIDVLRSTTTICHGMAAGCHRMIPVADLGEVTSLVEALGRGNLLLGGEKEARRIPGFDLGNSPSEYTASRLRGANMVVMTTNGTAALARLSHLRAVAIASLVNLGTVAAWLAEERRSIVIICAGHRDQFCLEDSVCGGMLIRRLMQALPEEEFQLNDAARVGLVLEERYRDKLRECLGESSHGRTLVELGLGADLDACAQVDKLDVLPFYCEEQITLKRPVHHAADTGSAAESDSAKLHVSPGRQSGQSDTGGGKRQ